MIKNVLYLLIIPCNPRFLHPPTAAVLDCQALSLREMYLSCCRDVLDYDYYCPTTPSLPEWSSLAIPAMTFCLFLLLRNCARRGNTN